MYRSDFPDGTIQVEGEEAAYKTIENLKRRGMEYVTTEFIRIYAFFVLQSSFRTEDLVASTDKELGAHVDLVAKIYRDIFTRHFEILQSVKYDQQTKVYEHGTVLVDWSVLANFYRKLISIYGVKSEQKIFMLRRFIGKNIVFVDTLNVK